MLADRARTLMPHDRVHIHIAQDEARMNTLAGLISFFAPDVQTILFPAWDCLPYDRVSPHPDIVARRVAALAQLQLWAQERKRATRLVLTTVNAVMQRVMPRDVLAGSSLSAHAGGKLDLTHLISYLSANGYTRTQTVREAGEFALRGGIIDLFPPGFEQPLRLDLFGDTVETIRSFDAESQRSLGHVKDFTLHPAAEFFLNEDSIARFRAGYRQHFGVTHASDPLYESVSQGRRIAGMDHWLPLFYPAMETIFDYAPGCGISMDHQTQTAREERLAQIADFFEARQNLHGAGKAVLGAVYHPLPVNALYLDVREWLNKTHDAETFSPFAQNESDARKGRDFADIRAVPGGDVFAAVETYIKDLQSKTFPSPRGREFKILISSSSAGAKERLKGLLENAGIKNLKDCRSFEDFKKLDSSEIGLCIVNLDHGFIAPDLAVITEQDILGDRLSPTTRKRKRAENFLREVSSLNEGDLVVHIDHGIGRFTALETLQVGKTLHDCLKIEYAGGDKLYVPVENMEVLSRFGGEDATVQLDKLGGAGWQARKAKAKKNLMEMADALLKIAAARQIQRAPALATEQSIYDEFAARFPYQETEDQDRAIVDVLGDLSRDYPMDRLICGDVGFGKTEVAVRAAYVAAMNGAQVAVIVPTTLLARQHYKTFAQRFAGTSIRVGQISRLVPAREAEQTRAGLEDGSVQIVIGTHALFASRIKFANLGLLVIDEEQRFGVKQKEKIKELKANVHVLTLSATPIPRTLQMSLTGVKEMSLITTPPVDRLAVRSFIMPFDPVIVREALLRERHRGGQSFYVCPRIKDMEEIEQTLRDLVPELKFVTAHGQMSPVELEERMNAFYEGQYDILLATNIIESGIDIPRANTMIIHRADMFGLAQLYQIRGRIGRSKLRGYAYLTYAPGMALNPQAMKRLEVMEQLDSLGAGFQLASHDMDIRGAGNLLGEQQSGHVREIGVELYQQMLEEAVAAVRAGTDFERAPDTHWSPTINLGTSVLIPEDYVPDLSVRMSLYRRLADLTSRDEIEAFAAELIDRFGKLPAEVNNLLDIVTIKQLCKQAGVSVIEAGPKGAVITFHNNTPPDVPALLRWITERGGTVKLRPDQKLSAPRGWEKMEHRVKGVKQLLGELAGLATK
ncbi:MAG: transcription-repair coupling factor [Alphaproteobacteria bacterium]|nr:transcription-repair coupling factor [Alphaproteobacteria bacterium]